MRAPVLWLLVLLAPGALAIDPQPIADPALRARYELITEELRCLVCQNQTIADSNAELAVDLRRQVREMLEAGASNDDIRDYMVERYGDFVLYKPPLRSRTLALWFGPLVLLLLAGLFLWRVVAAHRGSGDAGADSAP